jgi:hypothetical protein
MSDRECLVQSKTLDKSQPESDYADSLEPYPLLSFKIATELYGGVLSKNGRQPLSLRELAHSVIGWHHKLSGHMDSRGSLLNRTAHV